MSLSEISKDIKLIFSKLDDLDNKFTALDNKFIVLDNKFTVLDNRVSNLESNIKEINKDIKEIKSYIRTDAEHFEEEVKKSLYNYLINTYFEYIFYIPPNSEFPKEFIILDSNKKHRTITDFDGVVIGTNDYNYLKKKKYTRIKNDNIKYKVTPKEKFNYTIHIIEAKHSLDIGKIKKKIKQIIQLKNIITSDGNNKPVFLNKFTENDIYLYFACPTINSKVTDFIKNKKYLDENYWKQNIVKTNFNVNELQFLDDKIKLVTTKGDNYIVF
jgi:hypothetical protein